MHAICVSQTGGPEVLEWTEVPDPVPGHRDLLVGLAAAGVNYIDTYQRRGLYPIGLPFVLGREGAGVVVSVGSEVSDWHPGESVAWASAAGSYAELVVVPQAAAVRVPGSLSLPLAGAAMMQGVTAHYLTADTFPLAKGRTCLVHAGAGGVGRLLIQMARHLGARVAATAGGTQKVDLASSAGADLVVDYLMGDFCAPIEEAYGPKPLDVVYDGVGKTTFAKGLDLLRPRGTMVLFGQSSGPVPPLDLQVLGDKGSLFVTRPTLGHHIATHSELERRACDVFGAIVDGWLDVHIGATFPLSEAAAAHRALEGRSTTGKVLLLPV